METCVRGFSYMPEIKAQQMELKYIETDELEQTWRASRRERVKLQEQKIWEDFVKEQDMVQSVCDSDPYQFLGDIPEPFFQGLLEKELQKVQEKKSEQEVEICIDDKLQYDEQDQIKQEMLIPPESPTVIEVETPKEREDSSDVFHIFYDDKEDELSGKEEVLNDSDKDAESVICTVREKSEEKIDKHTSPEPHKSPDKASNRSSSTISNMIKNSIYCAKVKELRLKINEQLLDIVASVESINVFTIDPEDLKKLLKRSSEFCIRFSRIHVYQLQRQIQDILRNNKSTTLPYGKHTQFQSQMVRIVSLHQNMLQSFQAYHKSLEQTSCVCESGQLCHTLTQLVRDVPAPPLSAAKDLYSDKLLSTCDMLDEIVNIHSAKVAEYMRNIEKSNNPYSNKENKCKGKKRAAGPLSMSSRKSASKVESRLSMYSLDTQRISLKRKPSTAKGNQPSAAADVRETPRRGSDKRAVDKVATPKIRKKWPFVHGSRGAPADADVSTLVETVDNCVSSHGSRDASPRPASKDLTPRKDSKNKEAGQRPKKLRENCKSKPKSQETSGRSQKSHATETSQGQGTSKSEEVSHDADETQNTVKPAEEPFKEKRRQDCSSRRSERDENKIAHFAPATSDVTKLVRQLCSGESVGGRNERVLGAKNAQLHCISSGSPRQQTTPQLLRILEETIQKKSPRRTIPKQTSARDMEKLRMLLNVSDQTTENLFQYRTKFVQHMLTSPMYANSAVGKPWEMISSVSEKIIDELLLTCAKEIQVPQLVQELYRRETN